MIRIIIALTLVSVLAACEVGVESEGTRGSIEGGTLENTPNQLNFSQADMEFDPVTGRLEFPVASAAPQSDVIDAQAPLVVPRGHYMAVFRHSRTPGGRYASFGLGDSSAGEAGRMGYVFSGEFVLMRAFKDTAQGGIPMQYVARSERAPVSLTGLVPAGPVDGIVLRNSYLEANGIQAPWQAGRPLVALPADRVSFDEWVVLDAGRSGTAPQYLGESRKWAQMIQAPMGVQAAGIVLVDDEGPIGIDPETGAYLVVPGWDSNARRIASR
ncbi:MAG: hypothetical protein N4A61_05890 [Pelagimonas sp.]|jgi:hypothetical protein|nr:hypothetical protein [Pelagimonas sp.]